jgi:2-dehydropantoate 2-reductase
VSRFVVIGAGAIGGVVGARLHQSGHDVALIARGAHHDAIKANGLTLETPIERVTLPIPVAATPGECGITAEDILLLATKTQDSEPVLDALRQSGGPDVPVVCLQNGVENERIALRRFANVYGAVVMSPTAHLEPGIVQGFGAKISGRIDIGVYPKGIDDCCRETCEALTDSRFLSTPREQIMPFKYAKLLANLGNAIQALCGAEAKAEELSARTQEEGRTVLQAHAIDFDDGGAAANLGGRWSDWEVGEIAGRARGGGSSWQSLMRGTGRIESDYLNGEIVLLGRLAGLPTPVNALLQSLAADAARERRLPGWITESEILARLN